MDRQVKKGKTIYGVLAFLCAVSLVVAGIGQLPSWRVDTWAEETGDTLPPFTYQDIDYGFTPEELGTVSDEEGISRLSLDEEVNPQMAAGQTVLPIAYGINAAGEITDQLPSMKNQGSYGNCWAFSALGASETGLISKGYATRDIDLSERQLTYYFYKKGAEIADPLGGTLGDYNENATSSSFWNIGGNSLLTIWHMASWCGPVLESLAPFTNSVSIEDREGLMGQPDSAKMAYGSDAYHLQNAYVLSIGKSYQDEGQRNLIKKMLLQYGALGMSYYADRSSGIFDNPEHDCYYNDSYTSTNHAIQVVGWDDRFPKEYFNEGHQPEADGAWLMKNSWGADGGTRAQNGYFWMSYYDYSLRDAVGYTTKYAYVYDVEPADNYDVIYQHDGDAGYKRLGNESGNYYGLKSGANVFEVPADCSRTEYLEAVSIGESSSGVAYTLNIYTDLSDDGNPTHGNLALSQKGVIAYNGYHTIPLEHRVALSPGSKYAVVFHFTDEPGFVYASRDFKLSPWNFVSKNTEGQSYYILAGDTVWRDAGVVNEAGSKKVEPTALRIKAFTSYEDKLMLDSDRIRLDETGDKAVIHVQSISENQLAVDALELGVDTVSSNNLKYRYASSDESIAKVWIDPEGDGTKAQIEAIGEGFCQVTVTSVLSGRTATCYVAVGKTDADAFVLYPEKDPDETGKEDETGNDEDIPETPGQEPSSPGKVPVTEEAVVLTGLSLDKKEMNLVCGKGYSFVADATYSGQTTDVWMVYWKSSDPSVASVNEYGEVETKRPGRVTITVYNGQISDSCELTVIPAKVEQVSVKRIGKDKVDIGWKKQLGSDGYQIYRATERSGKYKRIKTISKAAVNSCEAKGVYNKGSSMRAYYFKVRAYKVMEGKKVYGAWSGIRTLAPAKPAIRSVKKGSGNKLTVQFAKAARSDGYLIYRKEAGKNSYQKVACLAGNHKTAYTDRNRKKGGVYYYKVRGFRVLNGKRVLGPYSTKVKK